MLTVLLLSALIYLVVVDDGEADFVDCLRFLIVVLPLLGNGRRRQFATLRLYFLDYDIAFVELNTLALLFQIGGVEGCPIDGEMTLLAFVHRGNQRAGPSSASLRLEIGALQRIMYFNFVIIDHTAFFCMTVLAVLDGPSFERDVEKISSAIRLKLIRIGNDVALFPNVFETREHLILILNEQRQVIGLHQLLLPLITVETNVVSIELARCV